MRLLMLGDAHLTSPNVPEISVEPTAIDFVIVVGDLVDNQCRTPEVGTAVLKRIVQTIAPVGYVPGNHDYPYHDAFTNVDGVTDLTSSVAQEEIQFVGVGCDRFDAGPEIQYLDKPFHGDVVQIDEWLRAYREQGFQPSQSIEPESAHSEILDKEIERYRNRYQHIRDGLSSTTETEVLVSHIPPFNTPIDVIQQEHSPLQGHHWGSVAVRHAVLEYSPTLCLCGHIHHAAGVVDIDGTLCVNPGYRAAKRIETTGSSIGVEDIDINYP